MKNTKTTKNNVKLNSSDESTTNDTQIVAVDALPTILFRGRIDLEKFIYSVPGGKKHENLYYARIEAKNLAKTLNYPVPIHIMDKVSETPLALIDSYNPPKIREYAARKTTTKIRTIYTYITFNEDGETEVLGQEENLYYARIEASRAARRLGAKVDIHRENIETGEFLDIIAIYRIVDGKMKVENYK